MGFEAFAADVQAYGWNVHGAELYVDGVLTGSFGDTESKFPVYSATKSVLSIAAGMVWDRGRISFEKSVLDYLPGVYVSAMRPEQTAAYRSITLHRLMTMSVEGYPFRPEGENYLKFCLDWPVQHPEKHPTDADYEEAGTAPFDIFPSYEEWISHFQMDREPNMGELAQYHFGHLPVWVGGNAYFLGATVSAHEKDGFVCKDPGAFVRLENVEGQYVLKTNLLSLLDGFDCAVLGSEALGRAFEPEQRFENPDGTDILFDADYFGNHRGTRALPGPFTEEALADPETTLPLSTARG